LDGIRGKTIRGLPAVANRHAADLNSQMLTTRCRHALGAWLLLAAAAAAAAEGALPAGPWVGRGVADALEELREPGLDFIFSSELVPDDLHVREEPQGGSRLLIARDIVAQHGLALQVIRPGIYAVVRDSRRQALPAAGGGAGIAGAGPAGPTPLSEIVVSTSRYSLDGSRSIGAVTVHGSELAVQPVLGEDAIRAMGRLPGLAQNGFSAQSNIRGGEAGETLILLDGFPIRQAFHHPAYNNAFGVLDPGLIADAEAYTGGFPVRYGNRMAGVYDFTSVDPRSDFTRALGLSVFNATARLGDVIVPAGIDWVASGRVGTLQPFLDAFAEEDARPFNSDLHARVGWGEPDRLRLTANLLWTYDELDIGRDALGEDAEINSRLHYAWLRADHAWNERLEGSAWLGYSEVDSNRSGTMDKPGIATGSVRDRRSSRYLDLRARMSWQPAERHWLEGGFELTEEDATYRYDAAAAYSAAVADLFAREPSLARAAELTPSRERIAAFASHRWQLTYTLVSELGLRAQRTATQGTTSKEWIYDPRLGIRWQPWPSTALRAHWGSFHQTDEVHELKVEDGLTGFPEAQRSEHFILGVDHMLSNGLGLRLEWFRKSQGDPRPRFENLLDPLAVLPEIAPDRIMVAPSSAVIRGSELSLQHPGEALTWWGSVAWSEARDGIDGRNVPRSWDQEWAVTAGFDWVRGYWRLGAVASVHQGWPTTRVDDAGLGERNAGRFATRGALDLRAEYRRPLAVGSLAVSVEVTNAVNIGNTCCTALTAVGDGAGNTAFTTETSDWLPVVPSIGVLWEF
jgi:hypothetical protein